MVPRRLPAKTRAWLSRVSLWAAKNAQRLTDAGFDSWSDPDYVDCQAVSLFVGLVAEAAGHKVVMVVADEPAYHVWLRIDGAPFDPKLVWLRTYPEFATFRYTCFGGATEEVLSAFYAMAAAPELKAFAAAVLHEVPPP